MGFYEDGVYLYQGLLDDLGKLTSLHAIKNIVNPPLYDFQCVDLLKALAVKRFCLVHDTGLGKTIISSAYLKALKNIKLNFKALVIIKKSQEVETPKKIHKFCSISGTVLTASKSDLPTPGIIDRNDIIYVTHDFLSSPQHMLRLGMYIDEFCAIVADEIHLLSNFEEASSASMLLALSNRVEYFLGLTATPITTNVEQFARLLKIICPNEVDNFKKLGSSLKRYGLTSMPSRLADLFSIRKRELKNHKTILQFIEPEFHQIGAKGKDLFITTKGFGATIQMDTLVDNIKSRRPLRGLVYVNRTAIFKSLSERLDESGIKFNCISGKINNKPQDRDRVSKEFKNGEYDVLLTNAKEALDLDCDYIIFYEFTVHVKQFIGRGERGISLKPLEVIFMFTDNTDEYDYFNRNIYEISQEIQELLDLDYDDVLSYNKIEKIKHKSY